MSENNEEQIKAATEEDEGLDAGFSGGNAPEAKPAEPEPQTEPEPAPAPAPASTPEPEPKPTPAETALMNKLSNLVEGRLRNHTGHINKILDEKLKTVTTTDVQAAAKAAKAEGGDSPDNQQVQAALKDGEKMKKLVEEFPEFGEALLEAQGISAASIEKILSEKLKAGPIDTAQFASTGALSKVNQTLVTIAHRNWKSDTKTPEFSQWISTQADGTKSLADSDDPEDAIKLMDSYYEHRKASPSPAPAPNGKSSQQNRLAASAQPASTGKSVPQRVTDEDDAMEIGFKS